MKIIYVHGFLGENSSSQLGDNLAELAAKAKIDLEQFRWPSGNIDVILAAMLPLLREKNLSFENIFIRFMGSAQAAVAEWEKALVNSKYAAEDLLKRVASINADGRQEVRIIAFSAGARVVRLAYGPFGKTIPEPAKTHPGGDPIIIAGGAVPQNYLLPLASSVTNFYAVKDDVLEIGYPLFQLCVGYKRLEGENFLPGLMNLLNTKRTAAGRYGSEHYKNVRLNCKGHMDYERFAKNIFARAIAPIKKKGKI